MKVFVVEIKIQELYEDEITVFSTREKALKYAKEEIDEISKTNSVKLIGSIKDYWENQESGYWFDDEDGSFVSVTEFQVL